jgi:hypothetical protein
VQVPAGSRELPYTCVIGSGRRDLTGPPKGVHDCHSSARLEEPQRVLFAGRLDNPRQYTLPEHLIFSVACGNPSASLSPAQGIQQMAHPRRGELQRAGRPRPGRGRDRAPAGRPPAAAARGPSAPHAPRRRAPSRCARCSATPPRRPSCAAAHGSPVSWPYREHERKVG